MNNFLQILLHYIHEVVPAIIIGFLISGIIHEFIPTRFVEKYLGSKGIFPIFWATIVGTFLPVCCWGSLPIAVSFYKKGSRLGPILAFLVATPATSVSALIVSYKLLGLVFTIYIFFTVIIMGLVIGMVGNLFRYMPKAQNNEICPHCAEEITICKCEEGIWGRIKGIFSFAFIEMPKDIGLELLLGLILAAIVSAFVPIGRLITNYLSGFWAYPFAIVFGVIMYFCSTASVPFIHALIKQGMNVGAAFSMLIIGPITSYGTILVLKKEFGIKVLIYFLVSICFLATVFGLILFLSGHVFAITISEAEEEALRNNPSIQSARSRYESAMAKIPQAGSLEDPWVTYDYDQIMGKGQDSIIFSQEIPFPTKLALKRKIATTQAKCIYEEYKGKEREVLAKVRSTYAELYLAYRMIEINNENKALLGQLADTAGARYSLGKTGQQDALRAQVELAKINNNLVIWEQKRQISQAMLSILLNRSPDEDLGEPQLNVSIDTIPPVEELYSVAKDNRPELKAMRYLVDKARDSLALSRQEYLPDFMFSYEDMLNSDDWTGMIGISVPIWFWQKQDYMVKEMSAELKMAEADYKNMENMVLFEIKDAYTKVVTNKRLKELYETSFIPQAEQSLKSALTGYESGTIDFLSLLDSQRMLLDIKMQYYEILVNLEISIAELERVVGVDI